MAETRPDRRAGRVLDHPVLLAVAIVLAPVLWVICVASTSLHELLVGVVASIATVVFSIFVCSNSPARLKFRPRDVAQCFRLPSEIASGFWQVTRVLFRDLFHLEPAGDLYRVCAFDTDVHDPVRNARTVLAVSYTTASPNSIVIGVDVEQSRMLFHQLCPTKMSALGRALGARP